MQAVESQSLILYHTDLRGEWPQRSAQAFAARLPYVQRLRQGGGSANARASLAGTALALRVLGALMRRAVSARELVFAPGQKPRLAAGGALAAAGALGAAPGAVVRAGACPDFSISHSGPLVGCAAVAEGRVGFDVELGTDARRAQWVLREAALKATGEGIRALRETRVLHSHGGLLRWRGELWHVRRLEAFAGASACVVSSHAGDAIEVHAIALEELFAP